MLKTAKTLSKKECGLIFSYFQRTRPTSLCEFGTQYGCSTRAFLEMSRWLNLDLKIHSWDIVDRVKRINKKDFVFHLTNITGNEKQILDKMNPDVIFLDAHPYHMTKAIMDWCFRRSVDFIIHDICLYEEAKRKSNNFQNKQAKIQWEVYWITELISKALITKNFYKNEKLRVTCVRERYGVCVVEMKG